MKTGYVVLALVFLSAASVYAAEPDKPQVESEAAQKWKRLKAQEDWVSRLKKQIQGETGQLSEMRLSLAQAFKLDVKKIEADLYEFDEKTNKFTEKKEAQIPRSALPT